MIRIAALALAISPIGSSLAQTPPRPPAPTVPIGAILRAALDTSRATLPDSVDVAVAPRSVEIVMATLRTFQVPEVLWRLRYDSTTLTELSARKGPRVLTEADVDRCRGSAIPTDCSTRTLMGIFRLSPPTMRADTAVVDVAFHWASRQQMPAEGAYVARLKLLRDAAGVWRMVSRVFLFEV